MFRWFTEEELKHKFGWPCFYTVHYFVTFFFLKREWNANTTKAFKSCYDMKKDNRNNDCTVQLVLYFIIYINICCFLHPVFIYLIVAIVGVGGDELKRL